MKRYGEKASEKVSAALHEAKQGELRSGSGAKVTGRRQAIAIGLSEARKEGGKVPDQAAPVKKAAATSASSRSEPPAKSAAAKRAAAPVKKSAAGTKPPASAAAKKAPAKRAAVNKR